MNVTKTVINRKFSNISTGKYGISDDPSLFINGKRSHDSWELIFSTINKGVQTFGMPLTKDAFIFNGTENLNLTISTRVYFEDKQNMSKEYDIQEATCDYSMPFDMIHQNNTDQNFLNQDLQDIFVACQKGESAVQGIDVFYNYDKDKGLFNFYKVNIDVYLPIRNLTMQPLTITNVDLSCYYQDGQLNKQSISPSNRALLLNTSDDFQFEYEYAPYVLNLSIAKSLNVKYAIKGEFMQSVPPFELTTSYAIPIDLHQIFDDMFRAVGQNANENSQLYTYTQNYTVPYNASFHFGNYEDSLFVQLIGYQGNAQGKMVPYQIPKANGFNYKKLLIILGAVAGFVILVIIVSVCVSNFVKNRRLHQREKRQLLG